MVAASDTSAVENLFEYFKRQTDGDPSAAATLVLAQVMLGSGRQKTSPVSDLLTVASAATRLGVARRTVYRLCDEGALSHVRLGSGRGTIRIRAADLHALERKTMKAAMPKHGITLQQLREV